MASSGDWRSSLTATERYENIQRIQQVLITAGSGFAVESQAYKSSRCREEYDAACSSALNQIPAQVTRTDSSPRDPPQAGPDSATGTEEPDGIRIGPYRNCHYIASGVTAEVYRCGDRALKVITDARPTEPHNPHREAKILSLLKKPVIPLLETFRDHEQRFVLAFPYMPLTLGALLYPDQLPAAAPPPLTLSQTKAIFTDVFCALASIHSQGIIHRDVKPSAILLASPSGPAYLSDFGTAWHPDLSAATEPADDKVLDVGTGPYRAPEVLFGDRSYGTAVDMWAAGAMLAECLRRPRHEPLFESRPAHEDGNQLGLILSIFKTVGSPTRESWPEAERFRTPPFEMYRTFEGRGWESILPGVEGGWRGLVAALVRYSGRISAEEALRFECMAPDPISDGK